MDDAFYRVKEFTLPNGSDHVVYDLHSFFFGRREFVYLLTNIILRYTVH